MDMLVKLYDLPSSAHLHETLMHEGITIRRALAPEMSVMLRWVKNHFSVNWADECQVAFSNHPVSCFVAIEGGNILGFACYDVTQLNFFGPTGVPEEARGKGIGKALLLVTLEAMRHKGYGYAIIGGVGPVGFYQKHAHAVVIEGSTPGIYQQLLKDRQTT